MRLIVFGPQVPPQLAERLGADGLALQHVPEPEPDGESVVAVLAAALRGAEAAMGGGEIAGAIVTGSGDRALGAALAAVKLEVPTVWVAPAAEPGDLVGLVADLTVGATEDAAASARSIRQLAAPKE